MSKMHMLVFKFNCSFNQRPYN